MDLNNDEILGTIYGDHITEKERKMLGNRLVIGTYLIIYMYQDFK